VRRLLPLLLLGGCLERTTGEDKPLDERFLQQVGETSAGAAVIQGPTVVARGTALSELDHGVDIDVSLLDPQAPGGRKALGKTMMDGAGPFEVTVPANQAGVVLVLFQDLQGDGPSAEDPYATLTLDTQGVDLEGLEAQLVVGGFGPSQVAPAPPGAPGGDPMGSPPPSSAAPPAAAVSAEQAPAASQLFPGHSGSRVTIRGQVDSPAGLPVEISLFTGDEATPAGSITLAAPGPFELSVPRGLGRLRLLVGQDLDGGGISGADPVASRALTVGEIDLDGVDLVLEPAAGASFPARAEGTAAGEAVGSPPVVAHVEAPPGGGADPAAGLAGPFDRYEGEVVLVKGLLLSKQAGMVDLDLRVPDDEAQGGVRALGKILLEEPGEFAFRVPKGMGDLRIEAFQDLSRDGPDDADPWAATLVEVGEADIEGVRLMLVAGARGGAAEHREVGHSVMGEGASVAVSLENVDRPVDPSGVGPFANHRGAMVRLKGVVSAPVDAPVDIDVWIDDPEAPGGKRNQGKIILLSPGPFSIRVPKTGGAMALEAYQDTEADGPSQADLFARVELEVRGADVEGIALALSQTGNRGGAGATRPAAVDRLPFAEVEGPRITVAGVVQGARQAPVILDFRVPDAQAPGGVARVGQITLPGPGVFEFSLPRDLGAFEIEAFQDPGLDGPDDSDPYGRLSLQIAAADQQVRVELRDGGRALLAAAAGAPASGGGPAAATVEADAFPAHTGARVHLSGRLEWSGDQLVNLDIFKVDATAPGGRSIAGKLKLRAGAFAFTAPADFGPMELEAYVDLDGDGPTGTDPSGRCAQNPLSVGSEDIDGLIIEIAAP
jgi:hypothetical protein